MNIIKPFNLLIIGILLIVVSYFWGLKQNNEFNDIDLDSSEPENKE